MSGQVRKGTDPRPNGLGWWTAAWTEGGRTDAGSLASVPRPWRGQVEACTSALLENAFPLLSLGGGALLSPMGAVGRPHRPCAERLMPTTTWAPPWRRPVPVGEGSQQPARPTSLALQAGCAPGSLRAPARPPTPTPHGHRPRPAPRATPRDRCLAKVALSGGWAGRRVAPPAGRGDEGTPPHGGVIGGWACAWEGPFQGKNNAVSKWWGIWAHFQQLYANHMQMSQFSFRFRAAVFQETESCPHSEREPTPPEAEPSGGARCCPPRS